uniref:5-hydroxytryptamine receptor 3A-like n=1 Tax=Styela clava TaxID=7725 RepID=UPI0019399F17|nr:5-hydroxytryptamine receptor 3A-like [Styela clava]
MDKNVRDRKIFCRGKFKTLIFTILILSGSIRISAKSRSSGGKSIAKSSLPGLGKLQSNNLGTSDKNKNPDTVHELSGTNTALYALKRFLMTGYDKGMRPVRNDTDILEVEVDVIYRQVLDMDEKNQILSSLVWYRQHWQDIYLRWEPEHHQGLEELWLPAESVWRPDIVLQEETGTKDYSPRLPFVKVNHDGHVEYHEPTSFTTTCSMNTMHFPFDVQHCTLTFSSWTHPGSKISLMPERKTEQMVNDIQVFVNTGEWKLQHVGVKIQTANYSSIMVESASDYTDWPEVVFTVTLRRNSSFYMQSMMFPSILLTSIALLGFFLPPDSGERVGLQITILLTFMVFLLTVCEMFPASTGPYLGTYYVICIFLLAVNLLMTVLVLRLYYHPCKPVPTWIKTFLFQLGRCCFFDVTQLEEFRDFLGDQKSGVGKISDKKSTNRDKSPRPRVAKSCLCNVMLSCLKEVDEHTSPPGGRIINKREYHFRHSKLHLYGDHSSPPYQRSRVFSIKRSARLNRCDECVNDVSPGSLSDGSLFRECITPPLKMGSQQKKHFRKYLYDRNEIRADGGPTGEDKSLFRIPQCTYSESRAPIFPKKT